MERSEENYLECRSFPDSAGEFQEHAETEFGDGQSSEVILCEPQDSDCVPSVFLAIFLALVFVLVSWLLLPSSKGSRMLLHDYQATRSSESCPQVPCLRTLHLFFPNQPESTWWVLQQLVNHKPDRCQTDSTWILTAVGQGEAHNTLLCFLKAVILLVTDKHAVGIPFVKQSSAWVPWTSVLGNGTSAITTTEIYLGQSRIPYSMMVSLRSTSGNRSGTEISLAWLMNIKEQAREEFLLHGLTPATVSGFLSGVFADSMPNEFITAQGSVPVLFVRPEWYLEGGLFC